MSNFNISDAKFNALLAMAGKKLGQNPDQLKEKLQQGKVDDLLNKMDADSAGKVKNVLNDPKAMEDLMKNDKIRDLLSKFSG